MDSWVNYMYETKHIFISVCKKKTVNIYQNTLYLGWGVYARLYGMVKEPGSAMYIDGRPIRSESL